MSADPLAAFFSAAQPSPRPPTPPLGLYDAHIMRHGLPPASPPRPRRHSVARSAPGNSRVTVMPTAATPSITRTSSPRRKPKNNAAKDNDAFYAGARWQSALPDARSLPKPIFAHIQQAAVEHGQLKYSDSEDSRSGLDSPQRTPTSISSFEAKNGLADAAFWLDSIPSAVRARSAADVPVSDSALKLLNSLDSSSTITEATTTTTISTPSPPRVHQLHGVSPTIIPFGWSKPAQTTPPSLVALSHDRRYCARNNSEVHQYYRPHYPMDSFPSKSAVSRACVVDAQSSDLRTLELKQLLRLA